MGVREMVKDLSEEITEMTPLAARLYGGLTLLVSGCAYAEKFHSPATYTGDFVPLGLLTVASGLFARGHTLASERKNQKSL